MACRISTAFSFQAAGIAAGMHGWCAVGMREVEAMGLSRIHAATAQAACVIDPAMAMLPLLLFLQTAAQPPYGSHGSQHTSPAGSFTPALLAVGQQVQL